MASTALQAARAAAEEEFAAYLHASHATAAAHVPESVIRAARIAYARAGGREAVVVIGHGNTTHPVCSITVERDGRQAAKEEMAAALRRYADEIEHGA